MVVYGGGSGYDRMDPDLVAVSIDGQLPDDCIVSKSTVYVKTVDCQGAYAGMPEEPIPQV